MRYGELDTDPRMGQYIKQAWIDVARQQTQSILQ